MTLNPVLEMKMGGWIEFSRFFLLSFFLIQNRLSVCVLVCVRVKGVCGVGYHIAGKLPVSLLTDQR